jgi:Flp pilus assembly CpaE family ATPase
MSLIVLVGAKGAPGVTTTALALATTWPLAPDAASPDGLPVASARVSLVDADLAGSGIAAGYLRGAVPDGASLVSVAIRGALSRAVLPEMVALDETGTRAVLLGVNDPAQATSVAPVLLATIESLLGVGDVLVDVGRVTRLADIPVIAEVVERADVVLVVCRSSLASVSSARHLAAQLRSQAAGSAREGRLGLAVVGPGRPYPTADVAAAVGLPVLAELPWDPDAAEVFSDGAAPSWRFARSVLLRAARATASDLAGRTTLARRLSTGTTEAASVRVAVTHG